MFDEKSGVWIKIYKIYTVVMFWLLTIVGLVMSILSWCKEIYPLEFLGIGDQLISGFICLFCGIFLGFVQLATNMLIISMLNNIQQIRQKVDKM